MQFARWTIPAVAIGVSLGAQQPAPRPMTFLDQQLMRQVASPALSPDGQSMLYTLSVPNWKEAKRFTDVYVVSTTAGLPSTRQLTFTRDKNESTPRWAPNGAFFVFTSNRDASAGAGGAGAGGAGAGGAGAGAGEIGRAHV